MALTATVIKKSVQRIQKDLYAVTMNLRVMDGVTEAINKDYMEKYRVGQVIPSIVAKFIIDMQFDIDKYKEEQAIYNNAQMNTAVTNIQTGLTM